MPGRYADNRSPVKCSLFPGEAITETRSSEDVCEISHLFNCFLLASYWKENSLIAILICKHIVQKRLSSALIAVCHKPHSGINITARMNPVVWEINLLHVLIISVTHVSFFCQLYRYNS